jgi:SAM-dependent methyltransferase|tara:strand:+ start:76 stop:804 length:729 start_codon:yes stop_codon:yes gene_type:complete
MKLKKLLKNYIRYYPKYLSQKFKFKKLGGNITHNYMILDDYKASAGSASGHYFHQDLLVASFIKKDNPIKHIDIGSRIDGFVAHVASFREIDVMDIRNLEISEHKNINFIQKDMMDKNSLEENITDSISCLHAIEHFGLGRYGDKIDINGHINGFNNIIKMLKSGGKLYISFPIGKRNEIHFNAHRVFHHNDIFNWNESLDNIILERFDFVDDRGKLNLNKNLNTDCKEIKFGCGIYTFQKV